MRVVKRIVAVGATVCMALILHQLYIHTIGSKVIGSISGAEWECVIIADKVYEIDHSNPFSNADRGKFLGIVSGGNIEFRVYTVKSDVEGRYIYCLWDWEGSFYRLVD